jgi:hypothetical protein
MKKTLFVLFVVIISFAMNANAALVDNGDGTITQIREDGTSLMWLQHADSYYGDWLTVMSWADSLVYAGYDNWRLPSSLNSDGSGPCYGYNCTESEMGNLYYVEGVNMDDQKVFDHVATLYWSNTEVNSNEAWGFAFGTSYSGMQGIDPKSSVVLAWAVRDVTIIPEPVSSALLLVGGTLLAGRRYLRRLHNNTLV